MKKKLMNIVLALSLISVGFIGTDSFSYAKTQTVGWDVSYDGNKFTSTYDVSKASITSAMPGDTIDYSIVYKNTSDTAAVFYLNTDIINSLEEKSIGGGSSDATGGAYSYKLSYKINDKEQVIYDSETIGGDNTTVLGLKQAEGNAKDNEAVYFNVGQLAASESGTINISIALDGNSQDNSYMSKLATLDVKFGVEKVEKPADKVERSTSVNRVVYTTPGGVEVVTLEDPSVPLAIQNTGNPVTGDSLLPIVFCTVAMLIGIILVVTYMVLSKKQGEGA